MVVAINVVAGMSSKELAVFKKKIDVDDCNDDNTPGLGDCSRPAHAFKIKTDNRKQNCNNP